jgi:hypothetical protein
LKVADKDTAKELKKKSMKLITKVALLYEEGKINEKVQGTVYSLGHPFYIIGHPFYGASFL